MLIALILVIFNIGTYIGQNILNFTLPICVSKWYSKAAKIEMTP